MLKRLLIFRVRGRFGGELLGCELNSGEKFLSCNCLRCWIGKDDAYDFNQMQLKKMKVE